MPRTPATVWSTDLKKWILTLDAPKIWSSRKMVGTNTKAEILNFQNLQSEWKNLQNWSNCIDLFACIANLAFLMQIWKIDFLAFWGRKIDFQEKCMALPRKQRLWTFRICNQNWKIIKIDRATSILHFSQQSILTNWTSKNVGWRFKCGANWFRIAVFSLDVIFNTTPHA